MLNSCKSTEHNKVIKATCAMVSVTCQWLKKFHSAEKMIIRIVDRVYHRLTLHARLRITSMRSICISLGLVSRSNSVMQWNQLSS